MLRTRLAGALVIVLTAACGSTIQVSSREVGQAVPQGAAAGPAATTPTGSSVPPGEVRASGAADNSSATSGGVAPATGPSAPTSGQDPTRTSSTVVRSSYAMGVPGYSQGIDATTIKIGLVVLKGGAAFAQGLGFSVSFGDTKTEFDAIVNDLNKRGGIHGRKIVPVYAYEDLTTPTNPQGTLCATFTQDHHVFAVLMPFNPLPEFTACTTKAHTLVLNNSTLQPDNSIDTNYRDWLFAPSMMSYARYPVSLVHELSAHHWFDGGDGKAGVVVIDNPDFTKPANNVLKPLLLSIGVKPDIVAVDASNFQSQLQTTILKFQRAGIKRVFFVQSGAGIPLYFMQDADKQGYLPKYALTSYESPDWFLANQAPKRQIASSVGIGWQPFMDVDPKTYPSTAQEKRCFALQKAAGETNANRTSDITSTSTCDLVWSFEAAARAAGPELSSPAWRAGYKAGGTSYQSVTTLTVDWRTGRNDGAGSYRWLAWKGSCSCFTYAGPLTKDLPG